MLTLALLPPIDDWVYIVVYTIYAITILGTIVIIITENRNPVKSLAWVLVLAFLPIVGLVFYIFFGQNFKAKRMVSRRIKRKLRKRDYHSIVNIDSLPLSEESKQEIRLCHSLCSVPYYSGSHVKIFTSGEDKFKHYLQDLEIAQEYIHIQYYIFEDDKLGNRVKEVLLRCARRGIQIRILYDDVGCWSVKKRFFKEMQDAGIAVRPFLEITFPQLASRINYRNHRKITVIDGKIGYIGGMNIADRYVEGTKWGTWRDTHLRIEGPHKEEITKAGLSFDRQYRQSSTERGEQARDKIVPQFVQCTVLFGKPREDIHFGRRQIQTLPARFGDCPRVYPYPILHLRGR